MAVELILITITLARANCATIIKIEKNVYTKYHNYMVYLSIYIDTIHEETQSNKKVLPTTIGKRVSKRFLTFRIIVAVLFFLPTAII